MVKVEGRRRRESQRMRWMGGITNAMDMNLSILWEMVRTKRPGVLQSMGSQRVGHDWPTEKQMSIYQSLTIFSQIILSMHWLIHTNNLQSIISLHGAPYSIQKDKTSNKEQPDLPNMLPVARGWPNIPKIQPSVMIRSSTTGAQLSGFESQLFSF